VTAVDEPHRGLEIKLSGEPLNQRVFFAESGGFGVIFS
jgi:hypothetical protein